MRLILELFLGLKLDPMPLSNIVLEYFVNQSVLFNSSETFKLLTNYCNGEHGTTTTADILDHEIFWIELSGKFAVYFFLVGIAICWWWWS